MAMNSNDNDIQNDVDDQDHWFDTTKDGVIRIHTVNNPGSVSVQDLEMLVPPHNTSFIPCKAAKLSSDLVESYLHVQLSLGLRLSPMSWSSQLKMSTSFQWEYFPELQGPNGNRFFNTSVAEQLNLRLKGIIPIMLPLTHCRLRQPST
ncbi:uncharacterized protein LACBIDRAFT_326308 [Laccaria bicolor S238N-H82]|uniref:Predicted protein n=1 Tax=Laccaria bicolor (strain S238N-H82 / ATCC MYA-4686) TaxID=486041 RepID=B0D802_LACBS|nr:uncharacterized protein LACBIDRAFT_326308 [Laccaria bicolor S238N-H82]EDR09732.1 predicted protein [Laccaria bicolor S238N-H82]|eukprot:XP_001880081.1 predicted protein [Laccaria bicolor S238N-H82]